jgi:hypothetical protein
MVTIGQVYVSAMHSDPFSEPSQVVVEETKTNSDGQLWVRYRYLHDRNGKMERGVMDCTMELECFERVYRPLESPSTDVPKEENKLKRIIKNAIGLLEV